MKQIVEQLQLLDSLPRKEHLTLLTTLAQTYPDVLYILSVTHRQSSRTRLFENQSKINIGDSIYSITEICKKLLHDNITRITFSSQVYFIIYKLCSESITQTTRDKLQVILNYTPISIRRATTGFTKECEFCGVTSNTDICYRCLDNIYAYTDYRRESFIVPIDFLNFKKFKEHIDISLRYKDWEITTKDQSLVFRLVDSLYNSLREDYELPFVEQQKQILS